MRGQVGFRHSLAAAQLLLFLAVSGYSLYARYEMRNASGESGQMLGAPGNSPHEWVQVCAIVNAPAVLAFGWIGRVVPAFISWIAIAFTGAGVFAQWFVVGLWRDESAGLIRRIEPTRARRSVRILWWFGFAAAILVGILAIAAQVFYFESSNSFLISLTIWCGFFAAFLLARIRGTGPTAGGELTLKI